MPKKNIDPFDFNPKESNVYKSTTIVVMFFDIIGFTKATTNDEMKDCIRNIEAAIVDELWDKYNWNETDAKNDFVLIPTGDGYSFAFHPSFRNEDILHVVKKFYCRLVRKMSFDIRMGIAKGPCQIYRDQNEKNNVFGYGINLANRVMCLAKENQILIHEDFAKEICQQSRNSELHRIKAEFLTKHGEVLRVYNFYGEMEGKKFGNPDVPDDPISLISGGKH